MLRTNSQVIGLHLIPSLGRSAGVQDDPTSWAIALTFAPRFNERMPALTRRRSPNRRQQCWEVYYGDVHVGAISERTGNPHDTEPWEWRCGFYPGSRPGECTSGTAATFDEARADFGTAWKVFLANRTEADFQAWRDQEAWTAEKYRRFDRGERMPPDWLVTLKGHVERCFGPWSFS